MADNLLAVTYGTQSLSGVDSFGATWRTFAPIEGWDGSPASTINLTPKPRASGSFLSSTPQMGPRNIHLNGIVDSPNPDVLQAAVDQLVESVTIDAAVLTVTRGATTRTCNVYRQDEVIVNEISDVTAEWSIQCVAPDPRRFGAAINASCLLAHQIGGLTIPTTIPFAINSTLVPAEIQIANPGSLRGSLTATIYGPVSGPYVSQVLPTGEVRTVSLPNLTIPSGDFVVLGDIDTQRAYQGYPMTPIDRYLGSRQWFRFLPGVINTFILGAVTYDPATQLVISALPAW